MRTLISAFILLFVGTVAAQEAREPVVLTEEARRIHAAGLLFDGHNDLPWQMREVGS